MTPQLITIEAAADAHLRIVVTSAAPPAITAYRGMADRAEVEVAVPPVPSVHERF